MGDPFSVAGTAVGITSLGIQVCQGLVQYYSQARSFHDDIDAAVQQAEGLTALFESLRRVEANMNSGDNNDKASEQLQVAINACQACLQRLNDQLRKCRATKEPDDIGDRIKLFRKRLSWPFKKDTITGLQETLDRMQANVQLALQILDVDATNRNFNSLIASTHAIIDRHDILHAQQTDQMVSLRRVEDSLKQQTFSMKLQMAYNTSQLSTALQQLQFLVNNPRILSLQNPGQVPPSLLEESITTYQEVHKSFKRDAKLRRGSFKQIQRQQGSHSDFRNCQCPAEHRMHWWFFSRIVSKSEWQSDHLPDCPYFDHGESSWDLEIDFTGLARIIRRRIRLGIFYARHRGEITILPKLMFKAVVSEDSPGFKPLHDALQWARNLLYSRSSGVSLESKQEVKRLCETVSSKTIQSFHDRAASPNDTLYDGTTILHVVCDFISKLIELQLVDTTTASALIDNILDAGVPLNAVARYENGYSRTPFSVLLGFVLAWHDDSVVDNSVMANTCSHMVQKLAEDVWSTDIIIHTQKFMDWLSHCLSQAESYLTYEDKAISSVWIGRVATQRVTFTAEDPFILRRSLPDFQEILSSGKWNVQKPPPANLMYWPECLRLYPLRFVQWSSYPMEAEALLSWAAWLADVDFLSLFINSGATVTKSCIEDALLRAYQIDTKVQERLFGLLAQTLKSQAMVGIHEDLTNLYHIARLTPTAAKCLWEAGFDDVDSIAEVVDITVDPVLDSKYTGTPLWIHLHFSDYRYMISTDLLEWLVSKGACMSWIHPGYGTTPSHVFVRRFTDSIIRPRTGVFGLKTIQNDDFTLKSIMSDCRDACICWCSESGCLPTTCTIQELMDEEPRSLWGGVKRYNADKIRMRAAGMATYLYEHVTSSDNRYPWVARAILRVMVFERLHLTHTCCRFIGQEMDFYGEYTRPSKDEIKEIHEIESEQIDLLEHLVLGLEQEWDQYKGSFEHFISNVLEVRVSEESAMTAGDSLKERAKIRELGVVLDGCESEDGSDGEIIYKDAVATPFGPERPPGLPEWILVRRRDCEINIRLGVLKNAFQRPVYHG